MLRTCLQAGRIEAGCDEAGRGPLAGPVAAAAVILPEGWNHPLLNDSKKMSEKNRYLLRETIEREAVTWAVEMVSHEVVPQMLLIDGNRFRTSLDIPYECIVKGDATFVSIAAASVLAKTYRDDYMNRIAEEYPVYNWKKNKGYPTREHREAVMRYGLSPYHRLSFSSHFAQPDLFGDREQATKP